MDIVKGLVVVAWLCSASSVAVAAEQIDFPVRGQHLTLTIYRPSVPQTKGTIVMGSGDVGWVGLAASTAKFLSDSGYLVIGLNVREYLSAFTTRGGGHLLPSEVQTDYSTLADFLGKRHLLESPVIVSGVSEGAGLAVLAASAPANHSWIRGVITMGLPPTCELAWRWSDFTSWITKKDSGEPSFAAKEFLRAISPIPIWMIQSTHDEYVTEHDYRELEAAAGSPKKLALIDASNHRFTDKIAELRQQYLAGLAWILLEHPSRVSLRHEPYGNARDFLQRLDVDDRDVIRDGVRHVRRLAIWR
jgi:type IV secretory pathway VirJ component